MHTHYTLEEASNPPKESGPYFVKLTYNRTDRAYFSGLTWDKENIEFWLRPVTEEERAKEMGKFAEWLGNNNYKAVVCLPVNGSQVWEQGEQFNTRKTTPQLFALFTQEREKQKQQTNQQQK